MTARTIKDLNPALVKTYGRVFAHGFLAAAQIADIVDGNQSIYSAGDRILAKGNWLRAGLRIRRNKTTRRRPSVT